MRSCLFTLVLLSCFTQGFCQQSHVDDRELNIRLSPSVNSKQLAELAQISEPISYKARPGESLASISARFYGIKGRLRDTLRELNSELVSDMRKQGKDFFWQNLPPGQVVQLPPFSKIISNVKVIASSKDEAINKAKAYYWQVGPKTFKAISEENPQLFDSLAKGGASVITHKGKLRVVFPAIPTFQSLPIRDGKAHAAENVLASLSTSGVATGGIMPPAFIEKVISPCVADATDGWFDKIAHIDEISVSKSALHETTVAVLDSGVDMNHDALAMRLWDGSIADTEDVEHDVGRTVGIDFTANPHSNDVTDVAPNSHGTHVSGIASGVAVARVIQPTRALPFDGIIAIMPLKVVDENLRVNVQAIEDALRFAQEYHANVISASWNVAKDPNLGTQMLYEQGSLFVLAAGNGIPVGDTRQGLDLETNDIYPPSFGLDNAITVGALGADGTPTEFSNFGNRKVHIFAPGCAISSTIRNNAFGQETGTSQAVPFVSFTAALISAQNPKLPPRVIKNRILQTADPVDASLKKSLAGNLNVAKAVSINKDVIETGDHVYSYGEVLDPTITIAAVGDSCEETQPLLIREQKVARVYRNYGGSGQDVAIQQNDHRTTGELCGTTITFKHESGFIEPIPLDHIIDVIFHL